MRHEYSPTRHAVAITAMAAPILVAAALTNRNTQAPIPTPTAPKLEVGHLLPIYDASSVYLEADIVTGTGDTALKGAHFSLVNPAGLPKGVTLSPTTEVSHTGHSEDVEATLTTPSSNSTKGNIAVKMTATEHNGHKIFLDETIAYTPAPNSQPYGSGPNQIPWPKAS
jgi:hypothetical protein